MVEVTVDYQGQLHTEVTHGPSGKTLTTDAPVDNEGKGESFSPTDLLATSLGTCILTVMGIVAGRHDIEFKGAKARVRKHMEVKPVRRIGKLEVRIEMPGGLSEKNRSLLERVAHTCPVCKTLHPEVEVPVEFKYPDSP